MSTLALDGSGQAGDTDRAASLLRYSDLFLLAVCLPVFLIVGWPLVGFAAGAGAWLFQRGVQYMVDRRAAAALAEGNRRGAFGALAATTLGRVWFLALAILLVGKIGDRADGLAAALLCLGLVTVYLGGTFLAKLLSGEEIR